MTTLKFTEKINAPKEKVWKTLWNDTTYRQWTAAFMEGSYAESDWNEGSKISFLTPNGDGMFSTIQKKTPPVDMVFKHIGEVKNGVEEIKDWGDATESYHLSDTNGATELAVEVKMDDSPELEQYFTATFPKALEIIKQLSEN